MTAGVKYFTVDDGEAGQRVDNYLIRHLKGVPKSRIYRILRRGEVRVNKGRVRPSHRLVAGDRVRVPPVREAKRARTETTPGRLRELERRIIHEDGRLLVVDKPAGIAVHGGSGVSQGLIETLRHARPECAHLELVHRLDKETSGLVLIAKRRSVLRSLHGLLRTGQVDKRYLALVFGRWPTGKKTVRAPLRKNVLRSGERMVTVDQSGRDAVTRFRTLNALKGATYVEATLVTGRTHQIRVHAAESGHPLAGDRKYGDRAFNREMRAHGLRRLFLHAAAIGWRDPDTGDDIEFSAPLADDLRFALDALEARRSSESGAGSGIR